MKLQAPIHMTQAGSYNVSSFATNIDAEIRRLNAQVDLFWHLELALLKRYGLKDGMSLLDCGCGPGRLIELLKGEMPGLHCSGLEMDPRLVETAHKMLVDRGLDKCRIVCGTAENPELPETTFDFIILRLVLEHIPQPLQALCSLKKLLRSGGRIMVIANDFEFHLRTWPPVAQLDRLYEAYGNSRRQDGGDPCIGRRLPHLFAQAELNIAGYEIEVAHNAIVGDKPFLLAEGAGIPAQLVKTGFLEQETLEEMTRNWRAMLLTPGHSIMRPLFVCVGEKYIEEKRELGDQTTPLQKGPTKQPERFSSISESSAEGPDKFLALVLALSMEVLEQKLEDIGKKQIDPEDVLPELGMDSLTALNLQEKIKNCTGIEIPIVKLLDNVRVRTLSEYLMSALAEAQVKPQPTDSTPEKRGPVKWEEGEI